MDLHSLLLLLTLVFTLTTNAESKLASEIDQSPSASRNPNRSEPLGLIPKTHLFFQNVLGEGQIVTVHPTIGAAVDYGAHNLAKDEIYEAVFYPDPLLNWSMDCEFRSSKGQVATGPVYTYFRDFRRCYKLCHWNITTDGVKGIDKDGRVGVFFSWN